MSQANSVLLPAARVEVFAIDDETAGAASELDKDWRFERVGLTVTNGGIEAATRKYAEYASPDIVIVQTEDIGGDFVDRLEGLASNCVEGTDAIVIGPTNDVHLYRKLTGMGVSDYLVKPIGKEDLADVIANTLIRKKGAAESRIVAVIGSKGGVGATTVAQSLGWIVSEKLNLKTLMIDAGAGWGTLGVGLGVEPQTSFHDALRIGATGDEDDVNRLLSKFSDKLHILAVGGDPLLTDGADIEAFETTLNRLLVTYPVVIIDLSGASRAIQKQTMALAHEIVIVSTSQLSSLRGCHSLLREIIEVRGNSDAVDLVVNMQGMIAAHEVSKSDIKTALNYEPDVFLPFDPKLVIGAEALGRPLGEQKGASKILDALMPVANRAVADQKGEEDDKEGKGGKDGKRGFLGLFGS